jgi:type IV fimbrial biogenesis protein FimT
MLRRAMKAKQTGFTLIELMFTIIVLAVLLGLAVPNFRDFLRNSRLTTTAI